MKIARFEKGGVRYGVIDGDKIETIEGDPFGKIKKTGKTHSLSEVRLLAPVEPPNIIAIGLNYKKHADESGFEYPERPVIFLKASSSACNPSDEIVLPAIAPDEVDYEAEMAIVIGKTAKNVSEDEALEYVLGYTCGNDVSARDCQIKLDKQWARGKSYDTFCPLGPWIETEMDGDNATVSSRVNGTTMQESNSSDMIFSCAKLVSYLSRCMTMRPGTVIMSGTPSGVGVARKPQVFLRPGDVVEVEVGGVGILRNTVAAEQV